jgi:hypothetical protein
MQHLSAHLPDYSIDRAPVGAISRRHEVLLIRTTCLRGLSPRGHLLASGSKSQRRTGARDGGMQGYLNWVRRATIARVQVRRSRHGRDAGAPPGATAPSSVLGQGQAMACSPALWPAGRRGWRRVAPRGFCLCERESGSRNPAKLALGANGCCPTVRHACYGLIYVMLFACAWTAVLTSASRSAR